MSQALKGTGDLMQVRNRAKRSEKLNLLIDVSALFQPASMTAIMGPSGSGAPYTL